MRVLLDCRMAGWSGVGRYTTGLARALAARADVELVQVCSSGEAPPAPAGFMVRAVSAGAHPFSLRGAMELARIARKLQPEVTHCLHFPTPLPVETPLVVTLHDLIPLVVPGVMPSLAKQMAYRLWNTRSTDAADSVIVPSRATARDVARLFPVARDKIVVVQEAADDLSSAPPGRLTETLARLTSSPYLLAMGNTKPHKGLNTLLGAFGILAPLFPDLRLLLAGREPDGYLRSQLAGVPAEVSDRVAFVGLQDDAGLRALYSAATVFVCPSLYEGFGLPVLEAMAMGAPVVCSDAASLPEVAGEAALLFPAGEQGTLATTIAHVLRDPVLRHKLIDAGRARAAGFSWAGTAAATVAVYSAVLQGKDSSASGWDDETRSSERRKDWG